MKIFSSLQKFLTIGGPSMNSPSWLFSSGITPHGRDKDFTPEQVASLTAVHRACTLFSDSLASSDWGISKKVPAGGHKKLTGTDATSALNNWQFCDREAFIFNAALLGNGYAVLHRNERGGVADIETVMSWRVGPEWRNGNLFYIVAPDENMNQPAERVISEADMLHLKFRVTGKHTLLGESPLVRLLPALDPILRVREGQRAVYKNLSAPGLVISTPKAMPTGAAERLGKTVKEFLSGSKLGGHIILDNELTMKGLPLGELINLQTVELSQFGIDEIARAWGVPPSLLGKTTDVNNSTSSEQNRQFATISLKPFARRLEDCISQKLFNRNDIGAGLKIEIDLLPLLLGAGSETAEYYSKLLNAGVMSVNEARNKNGLEDVTNGDVLRSPVNTINLDYWAEDYRPGQAPAAESKGMKTVKTIMRAS